MPERSGKEEFSLFFSLFFSIFLLNLQSFRRILLHGKNQSSYSIIEGKTMEVDEYG